MLGDAIASKKQDDEIYAKQVSSYLVHMSSHAGGWIAQIQAGYGVELPILADYCRKLLPQGLVIRGPYCLKLLPRSKYLLPQLTISLSVCRGGDYKFTGLTVKTEISLQLCRCFMHLKMQKFSRLPIQHWFYYILEHLYFDLTHYAINIWVCIKLQ